MGKVINNGWYKDSDPFYKEGWTMSVSLGLKPPSKGQSTKKPESNKLETEEDGFRAEQMRRLKVLRLFKARQDRTKT